MKPEDPLVTLESDKATMDVPAPSAGTVKELKVKVGDKVSEGSLILLLDSGAPARRRGREHHKAAVSAPPAPTSAPAGVAEVRVPDIGDFKDVPVIEVLVKPGDTVKAEDALVTLESDKATMDVPAPLGGVVRDIAVKVGDKVSEGALVLTLVTDSAQAAAATAAAPAPAPLRPRRRSRAAPAAASRRGDRRGGFALAYAGPGRAQARARARRDLGAVKGSGNKGRILKEDVESACEGRAGGARGGSRQPRRGGGRRRHRSPAVAEGRLREVRPGRGEAAVADQEDLRAPTCIATG